MIIKSIDIVKYFDFEDLIEGYSPSRNNSASSNTLMIITHKDSPINNLKDFKGKKLGLCINDEMDAIYLDASMLENKLGKYENYFSKVATYKKRSKVLLDIFFNKIDVAVITQGTLELVNEMNPQVAKVIKIIDQKSFPLGMAGFFSKNTNKNIVEVFYKGIGPISRSKRAKQILTVFKADVLVKTDKKKLKDLQNFYVHYQKLNKEKE